MHFSIFFLYNMQGHTFLRLELPIPAICISRYTVLSVCNLGGRSSSRQDNVSSQPRSAHYSDHVPFGTLPRRCPVYTFSVALHTIGYSKIHAFAQCGHQRTNHCATLLACPLAFDVNTISPTLNKMAAPNEPPRRVSMSYLLGLSNKPFKDPKPPTGPRQPPVRGIDEVVS
jgi:hypothetical protein